MKFSKKFNSKKKRLVFSLLILVIIIIVVGVYIYLNKNYNFGIPCLFHEIIGFYCPGCGITRAIIALLDGKFYLAFRYYNLIFLILPIALYYIINTNIRWILMKERKDINKYLGYFLIIVLVLYGILRNIPGFEILTPIN